MRLKVIISLGLCLGLILMTCGKMLSAQTVMTFKYGEREEYEGRLTAYLLLLGQDKNSKKRVSRVLTEENHTVDCSKYDQEMIVLQLTNLELADSSHYETCWLEIPLQTYFNKKTAGLNLVSKTIVLTIGSKDIPRARNTADIRFSPVSNLKGVTSGTFDFSFDFVSSEFPWQKISFRPVLPYKLESGSGKEEVITKSETKDPVSDIASVDEEEASAEDSAPSTAASLEEEMDLQLAIEDEEDAQEVLQLCEKYRVIYPDGHYLEEVVYKQITHATEETQIAEYLQTYVEQFPEGKYLSEVREKIRVDFPELKYLFDPAEKELESPEHMIKADLEVNDGILIIDNIEGGEPPYRLEFYEVEQPELKSYAIYIGNNLSFRTNLNSLPLEKSSYIIGLVDAAQTPPFLSKPLQVRSSNRFFRVKGSFIFTVLGSAVLAVALFLLLFSVFFKRKKRRRRGYYSRSYR